LEGKLTKKRISWRGNVGTNVGRKWQKRGFRNESGREIPRKETDQDGNKKIRNMSHRRKKEHGKTEIAKEAWSLHDPHQVRTL
jgi:hypothetical protein